MTIVFWDDPGFIPTLTVELERRGLQFLERWSDEGSTVVIFNAHDPFKEEDRAIKVFFKTGEKIKGEYQKARNALRHINHPNVVKLESGGHFTFNGQEIYYFVEEYFNGKNLTHIDPGVFESQDLVQRVDLAASFANAIDAIHSVYESHNDLHEGNILLSNSPPYLKVIDPGASLHNPVRGSPDYEDFFRIARIFFRKEEYERFGLSPEKSRSYADLREFKGLLHGLTESVTTPLQRGSFLTANEPPKPSNPAHFHMLMNQWREILVLSPLNVNSLILTLNRVQVFYFYHIFEFDDNTQLNIQETIAKVSLLPPQVINTCFSALNTIIHYMENATTSSKILEGKLFIIQTYAKNKIQQMYSLPELELQARFSTLNFLFRVLETYSWEVGDRDFLDILIVILTKLNQDSHESIKNIFNNYSRKFPLEFETFLLNSFSRTSEQGKKFILSLGHN